MRAALFRKSLYSTKLKAAACAALILLADFLFYGELTGWTIGGFCGVVLAFFLLGNPEALSSRAGKVISGLTFLQCLLMIDNPDYLSFILYLAGLIILAIISRG